MHLLRRYSPTKSCDCVQMANFVDFVLPVFSVSRVQLVYVFFDTKHLYHYCAKYK